MGGHRIAHRKGGPRGGGWLWGRHGSGKEKREEEGEEERREYEPLKVGDVKRLEVERHAKVLFSAWAIHTKSGSTVVH